MNWNAILDWPEYSKLLIGLIVMTDPIGNLPIFAGLTDSLSQTEKRRAVVSAVMTFVVTMVIFAFLGLRILNVFGITIDAFKVAGGVMFLFYGLSMMDIIELPSLVGDGAGEKSNTLGIVPLGIPMLAGPGTISTIVIYSGLSQTVEHQVLLLGVILSVALIMLLSLSAWARVSDRIGKTALSVMSKVTGLILAAIAIEFIFEGTASFFGIGL